MNSSLLRQVLGRTILLAATAACAGGETTGFVERDSAGVRITQAAAPQWSGRNAWQVAAEPELQIGAAEGEPPYLFTTISAAFRLDDGRIVVADSRASEIRLFDVHGRHILSMGRGGGGPGEFQNISRVWLEPESRRIAASDGLAARITRFDLGGGVLELLSVPPPQRGAFLTPFGQADDAVYFGVAGVSTFPEAETNVGAITRDTLGIFVFRRDQAPVLLRALPGRSRVIRERASGTYHYPFLPFSQDAVYATRGDRLYTASAGKAEVVVMRADGTTEAVFRWDAPLRSVSDALRADFIERIVASTTDADDARKMRLDFEALVFPEHLPYFQNLLLDSEGNVWLERYREAPGLAHEWDVLAADGRWLGAVRLPEGVLVHQIGRDFLLGEHRDSLGVRRIVLHELIRTGER